MVPGMRTALRTSESAGLISRIVELQGCNFWIRLLTLRVKCGRAVFFVTSSGSKCNGSLRQSKVVYLWMTTRL